MIVNPLIQEFLDKLGIKLVFDYKMKTMGRYDGGKKIFVNPKRGNEYTILHEIGHVVCGYVCCREHCEFEAHGVAQVLARLCNIKISDEDQEAMDQYAGWTPHHNCGRIERKKKI